MNASLFIRSLMIDNCSTERLMGIIASGIGREFEKDVELVIIDNKEYKVTMDNYSVTMSFDFVEGIKHMFYIDRFILEEFEKQGFEFDRKRSQYIEYSLADFRRLM